MAPAEERQRRSAGPPEEGGSVRAQRGRLTVRGVLEILAEQAPDRARAEVAPADEDLHAVLAFVEEESGSGAVR